MTMAAPRYLHLYVSGVPEINFRRNLQYNISSSD